MNSLPVLPDMLKPERLKQLNDHLVDTTGCFAFLKTDQVLFSPAPKSWQDAYTIFSIGLYAVYHDYGCKFLRFLLLDDALCPDALPTPRRHRIHIDTLNRDIRTNVAHGLLFSAQRTKLQRKLDNYYLKGNGCSETPNAWPSYVNQLNEAHWAQITKRLVTDSDNLYSFLWEWGDTWAKTPSRLPGLRAQFASYQDHFSNSFDDRICRPLLLSYGVPSRDISQYTGKDSPYIRLWKNALSQAYLNGTTHPDDLVQKLNYLISQEFQLPQNSSLDIAAQFGFDLDCFS